MKQPNDMASQLDIKLKGAILKKIWPKYGEGRGQKKYWEFKLFPTSFSKEEEFDLGTRWI